MKHVPTPLGFEFNSFLIPFGIYIIQIYFVFHVPLVVLVDSVVVVVVAASAGDPIRPRVGIYASPLDW